MVHNRVFVNNLRSNSLDVTSYTRHAAFGSIEEYMAFHHPRRELFRKYRREWENNTDNKLLFLQHETTSK